MSAQDCIDKMQHFVTKNQYKEAINVFNNFKHNCPNLLNNYIFSKAFNVYSKLNDINNTNQLYNEMKTARRFVMDLNESTFDFFMANATSNPNVHLATFPGSGHGIHIDQPAEFLKAFEAFSARLS